MFCLIFVNRYTFGHEEMRDSVFILEYKSKFNSFMESVSGGPSVDTFKFI